MILFSALSLLMSSPAFAEELYPSPGYFELLPTPDIVGDGATPVLLHMLALTPEGELFSGLNLSPSSKSSKVSDWTEVSPGIYQFKMIPPSITQSEVVAVKIKGKTAEKDKILVKSDFVVNPPLATRLSSSINPAKILLGRDHHATITFALQGDDQQHINPDDLLISVSDGSVENLTDMGDGRITATYAPPESDWPKLVMITVADIRDPDRVYSHLTVPLQVEMEYETTSEPNATVLLDVNGRKYGPVEADKRGNAKVPVLLGPGEFTANQTSVVDGHRTDTVVEIDAPPNRRIQFIPTQIGVPGDRSLEVPLRLVVVTPEGDPDPGATLSVQVNIGDISKPRHEGAGVWVSQFTPPATASNEAIELTASVDETEAATHTLNAIGQRPEAVRVHAPTSPIMGDKEVNVEVTVSGINDLTLPNRVLTLYPVGGSLLSDEEHSAGVHSLTFKTRGKGDLDLIAFARTPATGNPLHRVLLFPEYDSVPNDGISSNILTVVTVDEFDYPVGGVKVSLSHLGPDGSLPESTTTDEGGIGQIFYTSGRDSGLVQVSAVAGHSRYTTAFLQSQPMPEEFALPISGTQADISADERWRAIMSHTTIERLK